MVYDQNHFTELLQEEGELHAVVAEHDKELEIRKGQASIVGDRLKIETAHGTRYFDMREIVDYYVPQEIWH